MDRRKVSSSKEAVFHINLMGYTLKKFPTFKLKYLELLKTYRKIEGKFIIQARIRQFLKEFIQQIAFRRQLIILYKANKNSYSPQIQSNIERLTEQQDRFTDICLTNLMQNTVYCYILRHPIIVY